MFGLLARFLPQLSIGLGVLTLLTTGWAMYNGHRVEKRDENIRELRDLVDQKQSLLRQAASANATNQSAIDALQFELDQATYAADIFERNLAAAEKARAQTLADLEVERTRVKTKIVEVIKHDAESREWADIPIPDAVVDGLRPGARSDHPD